MIHDFNFRQHLVTLSNQYLGVAFIYQISFSTNEISTSVQHCWLFLYVVNFVTIKFNLIIFLLMSTDFNLTWQTIYGMSVVRKNVTY